MTQAIVPTNGADLAPVEEQSAGHLGDVLEMRESLSPQDRIKANAELVHALAPEIQREHLARIEGKDYMCVGGGIAIANAQGFALSVSEVTYDKALGVYSAIATMTDGVITASAPGYLGGDEARWMRGPKYAMLSMTQTRALAKLCRANFGHLYTLMGAASATPAEEMSGMNHVQRTAAAAPPAAPKPARRVEPQLKVEEKKVAPVAGGTQSPIVKMEFEVELVSKTTGKKYKKHHIYLADGTLVEAFVNNDSTALMHGIAEAMEREQTIELEFDYDQKFKNNTLTGFKVLEDAPAADLSAEKPHIASEDEIPW